MTLKEVRKLGIKYCEENKITYTYISHDNNNGFYLTDKESSQTVFFVNRNGSLKACYATKYAADFHKELKRRKNARRKDGKKKMAEAHNREYEVETDD